MASSPSDSFFKRHEFLILRLHSLSGLLPVVHLVTNASMLAGAQSFQEKVNTIHSLGPVLPLVEWTFIFLPIIFHAVVGVMIIRSGKANTSRYSYSGNVRYTLQRATAWIALVFIFWHVFHMHGWIHNDYWMDNLAHPLHGGQFNPEKATSTVGLALAPLTARVIYAIGVAACVFHFANGLWTMGITWGIWETAAAQRRAGWVCGTVGLLVFGIGMAAWFGAVDAGRPDNLIKAEAYELAEEHKREELHQLEEKYEGELREKPAADQPAKSAEDHAQPTAKPVSHSTRP